MPSEAELNLFDQEGLVFWAHQTSTGSIIRNAGLACKVKSGSQQVIIQFEDTINYKSKQIVFGQVAGS